jgi:hypothetical protein
VKRREEALGQALAETTAVGGGMRAGARGCREERTAGRDVGAAVVSQSAKAEVRRQRGGGAASVMCRARASEEYSENEHGRNKISSIQWK